MTPSTMITTHRPLPRNATTASASRIAGNASCTSANRISTRSAQPPRYPATMPITAPMVPEISATARPTNSEIRAP